MRGQKRVYKLILSGATEASDQFIQSECPDCEQAPVSYEALHLASFINRLRIIRKLKGEFLVISSDYHFEGRKIPNMAFCVGLAARCRKVAFLGGGESAQVLTRWALIKMIPKLLFGGLLDVATIAAGVAIVQLLRLWLRKPVSTRTDIPAEYDIAYLYPVVRQSTAPGGEMSYVRGTISGLVEAGARVEIISSIPLPSGNLPSHLISGESSLSLLREAQTLRYNFRFFQQAVKLLRRRRPRLLYQRHHAFVVSGALLSRVLKIPLMLEYQNSELWRANNWDPCHFRGLLRTAEDVSLKVGNGFAALSNVLRDELLARGIKQNKIVVNPAAADVHRFHPNCGGTEVRKRLGYNPDDIVVTFLGSFSYYHGIPVLQKTIVTLIVRRLQGGQGPKLKFLLIGDGLLRLAMMRELDAIDESKMVSFAGSVVHANVPAMLDASDILVSPHVPLEDGSAFFGSPSKLYEYMAAGKAIVASNLFQLAEVLEQRRTALLVTPASDLELTEAIELLACDAELRSTLGKNARATVLDRYTWRHNGLRLLTSIDSGLNSI